MEVRYHPEAESEWADLPRGERIIGPDAEVDKRAYDAAVQRAMERLREVVA